MLMCVQFDFLTVKIWRIVREPCIHWKKIDFQKQLFKHISIGSHADLAMSSFTHAMTVSMVLSAVPTLFSPAFPALKLPNFCLILQP